MAPLLLGLTILLVGDSHVTFKNTLLATLPDELTRQGAKVISYGLCSSKPEDWVDEKPTNTCGSTMRVGVEPITLSMQPGDVPPNIPALLEKWHPNAVIVVFGDAMAGYGQKDMPTNWIDDQVHALVDQVGSTNCIWVGPTWGAYNPRYGKTDQRTLQLAALLKKDVQPCHYIDSTTLMSRGHVETEDGIHLTTTEYQKWSAALSAQIIPLLVHKS
ncbi:SGNH/GDSL hydrolase family protein [Gluconacetobacter aggeris]|uniref:SGNH/GDSL hydrolase family protein n=1 Tax=Gluconacetobacter aggeris TaxID=1286186 RepID=A0A7W4NXB6_9PROT|nr:SGNH/GDSL hydrolase family protein [Gluconacetobacter aggeris]MBB2169572.1 SGNH/GDSL hydrolase family protein [Gluconacetobacter aggeris]